MALEPGFEREVQKQPGSSRGAQSAVSTNAHGTFPGFGGKKINTRDRDRHRAFCGNLILPSLLTKADFLAELANSKRVVASGFLDR